MRLLIRRQKLHKAGKEGLIAVQKQVTKKGKTFTQTFYVKPETVPSAPTKPFSTAIDLEKRPQKITLMRGDEVYDLESNRPEGGFYVATSSEAVRVPEKCIDRVFKYEGFTFVVYQRLIDPEDSSKRRWGGEYRVAELRTGKAVGGAFESAVEAKENALSKMSGLLAGVLKGTIEKTVSVASIDNVIVTTDSWPIDEPKKILTLEERQAFAKEVWEESLEGENGPVTLGAVEEWMENVEKVALNTDIPDLRDAISDDLVLEEAIIRDLTYEDSETRWKAIGDVQHLANQSDMVMDNEFAFEVVADWAEQNENDLVGGFNELQYGVDYSSGDDAWTAADVVAYAITNGVSLSDAQSAAEESTAEQEKDMHEETAENVDFTDSNGKDWDGDDLSKMGLWIGGRVRTTREAAKKVDELRRQGGDVEASTVDSIVDVIEKHATPYPFTETEALYRGTGFEAWLEGDIGDVIPVGMASFSKSQDKALGFNSTVLLILESSPDTDNPVMGIDVNKIAEEACDAGHCDAVSEMGVNSYDHEIEVIIRAPGFIIVSREANVVRIRPVEMSLLQVMKALFALGSKAARIAEMEKTFDYALHRESEDL